MIGWLCTHGEGLNGHAGVPVVAVKGWAVAEHVAAAGLQCQLIPADHTSLLPLLTMHSSATASGHGDQWQDLHYVPATTQPAAPGNIAGATRQQPT